MKRSLIRQLLFGFAFLCGLASYVYLNTQPGGLVAGARETESEPMEENQEVVLPDMVIVKNLADISRLIGTFSAN